MKNSILFLFILFSLNLFSQEELWQEDNLNNVPLSDVIDYETQVSKFSIYQLNEDLIKTKLEKAPLRSEGNSSGVILEFPYGENKFGRFEFFEVQTLSPELSFKYPSIKSYVGKSSNKNSDRVRVTLTPSGMYAKIFSTQGSVYINPITKRGSFYKVFNLKDAVFPSLDCDFQEDLVGEVSASTSGNNQRLVDDATIRTFRIAVATTAEYSQYHIEEAGITGGSDAQKKAVALGAVVVSVDRVNGILENDLAVNLQLIPDNDEIIFLDPATDPYTDFFSQITTRTYLQENINFLPGAVGDDNYDVGHVLTTRGGGVAFSPSVCNDNLKAGGVSGSRTPVGDGIDLTFAHEIGHQLGASHTFNNPCGGNRQDNSVYETGSGVTIMAYGSTGCAPNVQGFDFDYYHSASLIQIFNNIDNIPCAQSNSISNTAPSIVPTPNSVIPRGTPFVLEAVASDADDDLLTYNWEQFDNQISSQPPSSVSTVGPNFRNFQPNLSNLRYFPRMETLLNNQLQSTWEVLPNVSRNMNFALTVRDNNVNGGQNAQDFVRIDVEAAAGPFAVTSQNTPNIVWEVGDVVTITWDVAGTDANGVNADEVDFILSTNGGITFDRILLQNTPNDGIQEITVPTGIVGENCRLMVKASDNIFFALNEEFFNINATCISEENLTDVSIPDGIGFFEPEAGEPAESVISITEENTVQSISVFAQISHVNTKDIILELESPDGQVVELVNSSLCRTEGFSITFTDSAAALPTNDCDTTLEGVFSPSEPLSNFINGNAGGDWTLRATDFFVFGTGSIENWSIEICVASTLGSESFDKNDFNLFPNPANGLVNVNFSQPTSDVKIDIYDVNGRLIKALDAKDEVNTQPIDISSLSRGIYFVQVRQNDSQSVQKLIVR